MYFEFMNKTKLCAGENALTQLQYECDQYHIKHPLILTDSTLYQLKYVAKITKHLSIPYQLYTDIPVDSSIHVVKDIYHFYQQHQCDGIIALGGGSVLDTAKGVFLMLSQECDSFDEILGFEVMKKGKNIPFFAIPTTSGTGSEATSVAVIHHPQKNVKLEIISQYIQSDVAFLDPCLTIHLPLRVTSATAVDALVHAIEAYTCSGKNIMSDIYASTAISLISQNILKVIEKPKDKEIRSNLALASYIAGGAFSNSMVGIVHAIGHALGAVCHIPHGEAMSMLLIPCMKFNLDTNASLYGEILLYLDKEKYLSTKPEDLADVTISYLSNLLKILHSQTKLPISLNEVLSLKENMDEIAEKALNDGALLVNEKYVYKKDIIDILGGKYGY